MRAISRPLRGTCLLAARYAPFMLRKQAHPQRPAAQVGVALLAALLQCDSRSASAAPTDEEHPVRGAAAVWGSFRQDLLI